MSTSEEESSPAQRRPRVRLTVSQLAAIENLWLEARLAKPRGFDEQRYSHWRRWTIKLSLAKVGPIEFERGKIELVRDLRLVLSLHQAETDLRRPSRLSLQWADLARYLADRRATPGSRYLASGLADTRGDIDRFDEYLIPTGATVGMLVDEAVPEDYDRLALADFYAWLWDHPNTES